MWTHDESAGLEQVEKEMLTILRALEHFVGRHDVCMKDKTVFMETELQATTVWVEEGMRYAHADEKERADIVGDCVGAGIYLLKGGGKHEFMTKITKAIWRLFITHGIALRSRWIPGTEMCDDKGKGGLSVDDLSRRKYAPSTEWKIKAWAQRCIGNWLEQVHGEGTGAARWLHAKQIYSGEAYQKDLLKPGGTWVCFPPTEQVALWVGHLFQTGARAVLIIPVQHSAHNGVVTRATVTGLRATGKVQGDEASLSLGPAHRLFSAKEGRGKDKRVC